MIASPATMIRDCAAADMGPVQRIYAHHVEHGLGSFEEIPPDLSEMARRREGIVAAGYPYVVAEAAGQIVGFAYAGPYRTRSAYRFAAEDTVYVAPDAHRRGVGTMLLATVIERCAASGLRQLLAVIGDSGNAGSIGLHARMGFAQAGLLRSVGFKHGRWVDVVLMQRTLGPGDTRPP